MPTSETRTESPTDPQGVVSPRSRVDELLEQLGNGVENERKAVRRAQGRRRIVSGLTDDDDIRQGAALYPLLEAHCLNQEQASARFGVAPARIAGELLRFGSIGALGTRPDGSQLSSNQAEALRKMLLAIVTDPRLVLIKLAAQLASAA